MTPNKASNSVAFTFEVTVLVPCDVPNPKPLITTLVRIRDSAVALLGIVILIADVFQIIVVARSAL
jgi:hypothetical protein